MGIHPPSEKEDPWVVVEIPDLPYVFAATKGVFKVYSSKQDLEDGQPINYIYPDLSTFVTDMNTMNQMISDGPL